jgi:uncharacterized repeat protein (TIGR01451 family)
MDDSLDGGEGSDTLYGSDGLDTLAGGAGDDSIEGGAGDDSIDAGDGLDTAVGGEGSDSLDGGAGADSLYGGLGNDVITGGDGDDTLGSDEGDDTFYGGDGNDVISGGADADQLFGGEGNDVLDGGAGNDRLIGGERGVPRRNRRGCDNDSLTGAAGDDTLDGGRGRDLIDPGADVNDVTADPGRDTIIEGVGQIRLTRIRKSDARCDEHGNGRGRSARHAARRAAHRRGDEPPEAAQETTPTAGAVLSHNSSHAAKLAVTIATSAVSVPSAQQLTYTVSVKNSGSQAANNVKLYNTLPTDVTALSMTARDAQGQDVTCDLNKTNDMACDMGRVPADPNAIAEAQIEALVDAQPGSVIDSAGVKTSTSQSDKTGNTAQAINGVTDALYRVVVKAVGSGASESGTGSAQFEFSRLEQNGPELTVHFEVGGTAENGDFVAFPATVTIPATGCCGTITVTGQEDADQDGEQVTVTVQGGTGYNSSDPSSATINIADNDVVRPVVTITATRDASETGPTDGQFTVTRTPVGPGTIEVLFARGPASRAQEVSYQQGSFGFQQGSGDFFFGDRVTIPANQPSATITVRPIDDACYEGAESVIVQLQESLPEYTLGIPSSATISIADNDPGPDVATISAPDPDAFEPGSDTGTFRVSRCNANAALTVSFAVSGTAASGVDYQSIGSSVTIPVGDFYKDITVQPWDDSAVEGDETVIVTLVDGENYDLGQASATSVAIHDNDCGTDAKVDKLKHDGKPLATWAGQPVTFTPKLRPKDPAVGNGSYIWESSEFLRRDSAGLHYGPWLPAEGTRVGATLVTTQPFAWSGQYRLRLVQCSGVETIAAAFVAFQERPTISINDVTVIEPASGSVNAVFTVRLSRVPDRDVTVDYRTFDLIATAPNDYTAHPPKKLTFRKGRDQTLTVAVAVHSDTVPERIERLETFLVRLSNPSENATIADRDGIGTIHEKCECPARVQLGAQSAVDILNGIPEAWETMTAAERAALEPVIIDALRLFTAGQLGVLVAVEFAFRYKVPGMLDLYETIVEFGWKLRYRPIINFSSTAIDTYAYVVGEDHIINAETQTLMINTAATVDAQGTVTSYASAATVAARVSSALNATRAYTRANRAAQAAIRANREAHIQAIIAKFKTNFRESIYLAAAQQKDPTANSQGFDCALRQLAGAYVDGVLMFLKMHWGAEPSQGKRWFAYQNRFNQPWCADWREFLWHGDTVYYPRPYLQHFILRQCPEIQRYFALDSAQFHTHTEKIRGFTSEHNLVIVAPVNVVPQLRYSLNPNDPLRLNEVVADPADLIWPHETLKSTDPRIVFFDPWSSILPKAYDITDHPTSVTNLGDF